MVEIERKCAGIFTTKFMASARQLPHVLQRFSGGQILQSLPNPLRPNLSMSSLEQRVPITLFTETIIQKLYVHSFDAPLTPKVNMFFTDRCFQCVFRESQSPFQDDDYHRSEATLIWCMILK